MAKYYDKHAYYYVQMLTWIYRIYIYIILYIDCRIVQGDEREPGFINASNV